MQRKLITLAVAGLMSAPAFAQTNVTLYGSIDYGYVSLGSGYNRAVDGEKIKGRNALDSGVSKSNRIGVKGTEDLGGGLKAVFVLENGMTGDTQGSNGFLSGSNRQSYAGLASSFGTVTFGRQYTPQHLFGAAIDPFGKNGLGNVGNVLFQDKRLSNLAAYTSPDFGGFKFVVGYSFNGGILHQDEAPENNRDTRVWAIAPSFTWDKLFVGANYHNVRVNRDNRLGAPTTSADDGYGALHTYDLFAAYDFGVAKVGATVGRRTTKKAAISGNPDKDSRITQWLLGATFRLTPSDSILTSYGRAAENRVFNSQDGRPRISQFALGYEHGLSKRTILFSQFAIQSHNSAHRSGIGFHTLGDVGPVGTVAAGYGSDPLVSGTPVSSTPYRRGFAAGMRHDF